MFFIIQIAYIWLEFSQLKLSRRNTTLEQKLVQQLQDGEDHCIEQLYDMYGGVLYGIILKIVQRETIAEDILQEVFMKIWENGYQYNESKGKLFTWILNVARNTAIDYTRSADFKNEKKQHSNVSEGDNAIKTSFDEMVGVRDMVFRLEPKYQEIIDLIYFKGFTHTEAADNLGIPLGTVKTRARQALKELKEKVI